MGTMEATHDQQTCSYLMEILLLHEKIVCQSILLIMQSILLIICILLIKHHIQFCSTSEQHHKTCCSSEESQNSRLRNAFHMDSDVTNACVARCYNSSIVNSCQTFFDYNSDGMILIFVSSTTKTIATLARKNFSPNWRYFWYFSNHHILTL